MTFGAHICCDTATSRVYKRNFETLPICFEASRDCYFIRENTLQDHHAAIIVDFHHYTERSGILTTLDQTL